MVFTTRLAGGKGGRNALETELQHLGVTQKNARPNHPTTCGKVERFQQTLLDAFIVEYNHHRVRHEAPHDRTEVKDLRRRAVAAAGQKLRAA